MNILVLNQNFETISIIDSFESMLWVDRYDEPGEFEIYTAVREDLLKYPVPNNYLKFKESDKLMIIENLEIITSAEEGNHIKITGRSLESILDRRVISTMANAQELNVTGNLQTSIKNLITNNIISPTDTSRKIDNFVFAESSDAGIVDLTYENQFKGESVLDIVEQMCQSRDLGFKIVLNNANQFEFSLYKGADRSYSNEYNDFVIFKPSFDNIIKADYTEKNSEAKTFCYLHAQYSSGSSQVDKIVTKGEGTGLLRKEVYVDSSISLESGMTMATWESMLNEDAAASLSERKVKKAFDGECETTRMFVYSRDFFLGDIVQVADEYGHETPSRITEYLWSISDSGTENYPTFTAINE